MQARDVMTTHFACCDPQTPLNRVAQVMLQNECALVPVLEGNGGQRVIGMVTERDIVCRAVAQGRDPSRTTARAVMSSPAAAVPAGAALDEVREVMRSRGVECVAVIGEKG